MRYSALILLAAAYAPYNNLNADEVKGAQQVLAEALLVEPSELTHEGAAFSGYSHLPKMIWRESYARQKNQKWDIYRALNEEKLKGEVLEKKLTIYSQIDISMIFWLDEDNSIIRYQRKTPSTKVLSKDLMGIEAQFSAFINYDSSGAITHISQNILFIDDNNKDAYISYIDINNEGGINSIHTDGFDYFQLERGEN